MSIVLRRTLFLDRQGSGDIDELYGSLRLDLRTELTNRLGLQNLPEVLASWPDATWSNGYGSSMATIREWMPETRCDRALLQIEFTECHRDYEWVIDLSLGRYEQEIVLYEEAQALPPMPAIPFAELPDLMSFSERAWKDEDGLAAGGIYAVGQDRVEAFVDFVKSPERKMPIILISATRQQPAYLLPETKQLARQLQGLAHVIRLNDDACAVRLRSLQPSHSCYDGAVRIYWPGYKPSDNPNLHPFWSPRQLQSESARVSRDILTVIAKESPRIFSKNSDIKVLEDQHLAEESRKQVAEVEARFREQLRLRLQEQQDADLDEWIAEYDRVEHENRVLRQENEELMAAQSQLQHKVYALRGQLNNWWQSRQPFQSEEKSRAKIYLSSKARRQFAAFDHSEQLYWEEHLVQKLLDAELRKSQTAAIPGRNGTSWVYPRSRSAGGRRVLYYGDGEEVFVCELFTGAEHDDEYEAARDQGIDLEDYRDFEAWGANKVLEQASGLTM